MQNRAGGFIVDYNIETDANHQTWNCLVWNDGWQTWLLVALYSIFCIVLFLPICHGNTTCIFPMKLLMYIQGSLHYL